MKLTREEHSKIFPGCEANYEKYLASQSLLFHPKEKCRPYDPLLDVKGPGIDYYSPAYAKRVQRLQARGNWETLTSLADPINGHMRKHLLRMKWKNK